jgi:hypothetical protein
MESLNDFAHQFLAQGVSPAWVIETYKPNILCNFRIDKGHALSFLNQDGFPGFFGQRVPEFRMYDVDEAPHAPH